MEKWRSDNWWVSKYNYLDSYRKDICIPEKVKIHDATLRDGEQTPGVVFTVNEKVEIAKLLDDLGVDRIEAGMPAVSPQDREAIKRIVALGLDAEIFSFSRAMKEDIDEAVECGVHGVIIEIPTGRPKLKYQFPKWTDEDVIRRSVEVVKYAKEKNLETIYFGYDTTRADFEFLKELYSVIVDEGKPDGIGIVDTMGCILPGAMKELVSELKSLFDVKLEVHTHNDFGMANATSFAAMEAGAEVIHTCINGLGERTGNAALEEIMVGLKVLYGLDVPYKLDKLQEVSKKLISYANFTMPVNKPIVGNNIFIRESGIGIDLVQNKPLAMFALNPDFIGHKPGIVLGKKSGARSIEVKLQELGMEVEPDKIEQILIKVKEEGIQRKRTLTDDEFIAIVKNKMKKFDIIGEVDVNDKH